MEKTDLGQIASNMDSDRLADKAAPFINKEKVLGPDHKISIPDGARFRRQQSGYVLFFRYAPPTTKNHFEPMPEGAKQMQYPEYQPHAYNTHYGEPIFY